MCGGTHRLCLCTGLTIVSVVVCVCVFFLYIGRFYIIFNGMCASLLCFFSFDFLVQFTMLLMSMSALLFLYSFVNLRVCKPDMERPFRIPSKLVVLFTIPPCVITIANLVLALQDPAPVLGIEYFKLIAITGVILMGVIGT